MHHLRTTTIAAAVLSALSTPAVATPGSGFAPTGIVVGHFGTLQLNTAGNKTGKWGMILKTLDATDVGVDKLTVQPNGFSGWHSHPSAVFVTVTTGTIVWYDGSDPVCPHHTYTVGDSFIEDAYRIHNVRNASGSSNAEFIATHINPTGTSGPVFRQDEQEPTNCRF